MCGIFGYSGKAPVDLLRLSWLASENEIRGDDSTGVYGNWLAKKAKRAKEFILTDDYRAAVDGANLIIGHTRRATIGAKTQKNAHPFELSYGKGESGRSVVGVHNGQLFPTQWEALTKKYEIEKTDVDSEFIYQFMLYNNFDYDKTLSELDGMMALAFIRPEYPELLFLYRRPSRPLHIGFINGSDMYFSSEVEPLHLIGCTATEELEPDKLFVFKKGGLVGVSPVKKPIINITTRDQTITGFLTIATAQEKAVLGIHGVDAPTKTAHTTTKMMGRNFSPPHTHSPTNNHEVKYLPAPTSPNDKPLIIDDVNEALYVERSLETPKLGRTFESGDYSCCYLFVQLVSNYDYTVGLPAWVVRIQEEKTLSCVTTHNGIAALKIPLTLCGRTTTLEIVNPLQQNVIYTVEINRPVTSRVMEVTLVIPFPSQEEEAKSSEGAIFGKPPIHGTYISNEVQNSGLYSLSKYEDFLESCFDVLDDVRESRDESLSSEPEKRQFELFDEAVSTERPFLGSWLGPERILARGSNEDDGTESLNLDDTYYKITDILDMDYYTTGCNIDEIEGLLVKSRALLSEVDPDPRELQSVLIKIEAYLTYLGNYMDNRFTAIREESEEGDACGCS